ncbi:MAG: hypothetical protein EAY76_03040 [Alphaproteobacteria bacterium]|nr:MAG: hypothetical protein EAY76_03040 [Alphaproteobacteria bacterium]TAF76708.1 MAG: hypothetical protein EAZ52_02850 [Alphaproteobacteria bacterium]
MCDMQKRIYDIRDWRKHPEEGWHTEKFCKQFGFSEQDTITVIAAINATLQRKFEVYVDEESQPFRDQFVDIYRSADAKKFGDPDGFFGWVFRVTRETYYPLKHIPFVNDLRIWARMDMYILRDSKNPVVQKYIGKLNCMLIMQ